MFALLPPKVHGPVSVLSVIVVVSGALKGAKVQLLKNGAPIGVQETADHNGIARISINGLGVQAGDKLTAQQSKGNETSPPSQFPEQVMGAPTKLPAPIFLSQLHGCIDGVILGGTIVGATVKVSHNGTEIGVGVAEGTQTSVGVFHTTPLTTGSSLKAWQEITIGGTTHKSPETPSLPLVAPPNREQVLAPVMIVPPLYECDSSVLVTGIRDGAMMEIKTDQGQGSQYMFYGNDVRFSLLPLKLGESVTAKQYFRSCDMEGNPSAAVKAGPLTALPSARILPVICPGAKQVVVTDLVAGAEVTLYVGRNGSASMIGQATASHHTQAFDLPPTLPTFPDGPALYMEALQNRCNAGAAVTLKHPIESTPVVPGPPTIGTLVECSRVVHLSGLGPGSTIQITSDQQDWPVLSGAIQATSSVMSILLYRPVRNGEKVTVTVTGCGAGPGAAVTATVQPMPALAAPKIADPVRAWMNKVKVTDCVPGAQVHLYVNDIWRGRAEASETTVEIFAGDLKLEDRIVALQCLCTKISPKSEVVSVTPGKLRVKLQPEPVVRGPASQNVTVIVEDKDDRHKVPATIHMPGGSTFPANAPFGWIFPAGSASPAVKVTAVDYSSETVTWPLVDPPPTPPPTAPLNLQLLADAPAVIKSVNWVVYKQEVPPTAPSQVASTSGASATVILPKPTAGQIIYYITCSVTFEYGGTQQTATWVKHDVSNYPGSAMIGWSGGALTGKFALTGAQVANEEGGVDLVFWVYFWGVV